MYTLRTSATEALHTGRQLTDAAVTAWAGYLRAMAARGATPLDSAGDCFDLWQAATRRRPPRFAHPHTVVGEGSWTRLLRFSPADARLPTPAVPTLVLPPLSGHTSCVVDLAPGRSLVETAVTAGLTDVHCLDWTPPAPAPSPDGAVGIDEVVEAVSAAVAHLGGRVNLVSFSQSGWLAAMYAARRPERVHTLTVASAPIDFSRRTPPLPGLGRIASAARPIPIGQAAVLRWSEWPAQLARLADLCAGLHEPARVDAHIALESWFDTPCGVPEAFYRWVLSHLFVRNDLIGGRVEIDGAPVDLATIECPVFLLAGHRDQIVPAHQVWALADRVSTPPNRVVRRGVDCGHLDMLVDPGVLRRVWRPVLRDVAALSVR